MKTAWRSLTAFLSFCVVIAVPLGFFVHPLVPLYRDAGLRSDITAAMLRTADERGWLLSDMSLYCWHKDNRWHVYHQDHLRFQTIPGSDDNPELDSSLPACGG